MNPAVRQLLMGGGVARRLASSVVPIRWRDNGRTVVTLDGNAVFVFPVWADGGRYTQRITVTQDATGAWIPIFPADITWSGGVEPTPPLRPGESCDYDFTTTNGGQTWAAQQISAPSAPLVLDRFSRADSASSLGSGEIGGAWTAHAGTWGVNGGSGYCAARAGADSVASIDTGTANHTVYADITPGYLGAQPGLLGRVSDENNFWLALPGAANGSPQTVSLWKRVAGTYTQVQGAVSLPTGTLCIGQPARFAMKFSGNTIQVFINGVMYINQANQTSLNTNTRVGFRVNDDFQNRWSNLVAL